MKTTKTSRKKIFKLEGAPDAPSAIQNIDPYYQATSLNDDLLFSDDEEAVIELNATNTMIAAPFPFSVSTDKLQAKGNLYYFNEQNDLPPDAVEKDSLPPDINNNVISIITEKDSAEAPVNLDLMKESNIPVLFPNVMQPGTQLNHPLYDSALEEKEDNMAVTKANPSIPPALSKRKALQILPNVMQPGTQLNHPLYDSALEEKEDNMAVTKANPPIPPALSKRKALQREQSKPKKHLDSFLDGYSAYQYYKFTMDNLNVVVINGVPHIFNKFSNTYSPLIQKNFGLFVHLLPEDARDDITQGIFQRMTAIIMGADQRGDNKLPRLSIAKLCRSQNYLLFKNGIVDIHTCRIIHNISAKDLFFTRRIECEFPEEPVELDDTEFGRFLNATFKGVPGGKECFLEMLAVAASDIRIGKHLVWWHGDSNTGKSVSASILEELVGPENVSPMSPEDLSGKWGPGHLIGKWVILCGEEEQNKNINKALPVLKKISSGSLDLLYAPIKYQASAEFTPMAFPIFLSNTLPSIIIRDNNERNSLKNRITVLPFENVVPEERQNKKLRDDLKTKEEMEAIAWCLVNALRRYIANNFTFTECPLGSIYAEKILVEQQISAAEIETEYYNEMVSEFLKKHVTPMPDARTATEDLHNAFRLFCEENGTEDFHFNKNKWQSIVASYFPKNAIKSGKMIRDNKQVRAIIGITLHDANTIILPVKNNH